MTANVHDSLVDLSILRNKGNNGNSYRKFNILNGSIINMKKIKKFVSYSQLDDLILFDVFCGVNNGFYIDIGANNPWGGSVTKALYDRGFHGINIEPLMDEYRLLQLDRPRDINLCVGVGDKEGELTFYQMGPLSTFNVAIREQAVRDGKICSETKVPIVTLAKICKEYIPLHQEIHFCKIDVEGYEKEVLLGMDWNYKPHVFIIESTEPRTDKPTYYKWEAILLENGYKYILSNGVNRFYIDINVINNYEFIGINKLMDKYNINYATRMGYIKILVRKPKIILPMLFYIIKNNKALLQKYNPEKIND